MGKSYWFAGGETEAEAKRKITQAKTKRSAGSSAPQKVQKKSSQQLKPTLGICSDAGTHGNPGPCEYQVTDLNGNVLGHKHLGIHTNNYAELAGIGAMIQLAIAQGHQKLYTDSKIAMIWIRKGILGPNVQEAEQILAMIRKIQNFSKPILNWSF